MMGAFPLKGKFINDDWIPDIRRVSSTNFQLSPMDLQKITIERIGDIPMPLDVVVKLKDGRINAFNIPMRIMRGAKSDKSFYENLEVLKDWPWVYPQYSFNVPFDIDEIEKIMIDPTGRMADINQADNVFPNQKTIIFDTQQ